MPIDYHSTMTADEAGVSKGYKLGNTLGGMGGSIAASVAAPAVTHALGLAAGMAVPVVGPLLSLGVLGAQKLITRLTRKGREKKQATYTAEQMHNEVWNDIMPAYQRGEITQDQAKQETQAIIDSYKQALQGLGDKDVANRSLDQVNWLLYNNQQGTGKNWLTDNTSDVWGKYAPTNTTSDSSTGSGGQSGGTDWDWSKMFSSGGGDGWDWLKNSPFGDMFGSSQQSTGSTPETPAAPKPPTETTGQGAFNKMAGGKQFGLSGAGGVFGRMSNRSTGNVQSNAYYSGG